MDLGTAHSTFTAGIADSVFAVCDMKISQHCRACTDGGYIFAVFPGKGQRVHGLLAGPNGGNPAQTAGQHDHFKLGQIHFVQRDICFHTDPMAAVNSLAVNAYSQNIDAGAAH